jgi:class 3 adenylate cyclase
MVKVGVLALQGDVREHVRVLVEVGATPVEVRTPAQLADVQALVIPGGESTTIGKLARAYHLVEPIRRRAAEGLPVAEFGLALHVGELLYGNIGSWDRLDFTVIGPAVNEASRIEAMCGSLDQTVIVSSAFADTAPECRSRLVSLGRYALRGVARPQELFTLDPDALPG